MRRHETRNGIGLALATQANYIEWLGNLLRFAGNPVIDQMRSLRYVRFPLKVSTEVKALPMSTIEEIRLRLETMIGWDGSVARFMIAMYSYSGLRRSELRLARIQDLDVESWRIHVAHPKGEGRWASPGTAPILQPARTAVLKYLAERKQYLAANGIDYSDALVPHISRTGSCGYWTDAMWSWIKVDAQKHCRIPFTLQMLRRSFGQIAKDRGANIEAVSKALRHKTTKTTELYYARIRSDAAFKELEAVFSDYNSAENGLRAKVSD